MSSNAWQISTSLPAGGEEVDGMASLPRVSEVCDQARKDFMAFFNEQPGPKDLVIQSKELMAILEHIAPMKTLRKMGVEHIYLLEPEMTTGGPLRYYLTRPEIKPTQYIVNHIKSDVKAKEIQRKYHIMYVPRSLASCEYILERDGVIGHVKMLDWSLHLIPLDEHVLSLEHPNTARTLLLEGNYSILHQVASSLINLEEKFGTIPLVHGKGRFSQMVWDMFTRIKEVRGLKEFHHPTSGMGVSEVILFDRSCDWVTPMCSQLTYEGMLDDVFGIQTGFVELSKDSGDDQQMVKVLLNEDDPVFSLIRSMHFSGVSEVLINISKELQKHYDQGRDKSKSIQEMKEFVKKLPKLREKHDSLSTHLKASENIVRKKKHGDFQRHLNTEWLMLEGSDKATAYEHIEENIEGQSNKYTSLQFLCLASTTSDGIKSKYFHPFKKSFLSSYGHQHLVTFYHLQQVGLLKEKIRDDLPGRSLIKDESATFFQLQRLLKLVPKKPELYDLKNPTDASYVFGGAYTPLSVSAICNVVTNGNWRGIDDVIKGWEGPTFSHNQSSSQRKNAFQMKRVILVYFIGGCTYSEINALRFMGNKLNCHFIIATTDIINSKRLLDSFMQFDVISS
jgi:hypothetical protein